MKLPAPLHRRLLRWALRRMLRTPADFLIGGRDDPYLERWHIWRIKWLSSCYLHIVRRSDDDRALHDHPWFNVSILLDGGYLEVVPASAEDPAGAINALWRDAGAVTFRRASAAHRLVVRDGQPTVSLFITGPRIREWGFWCPKGWKPWRQFVDPDDIGQTGPGCGE